MALDQAANFVRGSLTAAVGPADTTFEVANAEQYPDPSTRQYNLVVWDADNHARPDQDSNVEIVRVSARDTTADELTVARGEENTSAASHPNSAAVQLSPTAKVVEDVQTKTSGLSDDGNSLSIEAAGITDASLGATDLFGHPRVPKLSQRDFPPEKLPADYVLVAPTSNISAWSAGSDATITEDTENYKTGVSAIQVDTNGNGQVVSPYDSAVSIDMSAGPVAYWVYVNGGGDLSRVGMYFFDSAGDFFRIDTNVDALKDGWNRVEFPRAAFNNADTVSGSPDDTDIVEIRFVMADSGQGNNASVTFDQVIQKPYTGNAKVMFRFDDVPEDTWTVAKPVLDKYGVPGSNAVTTDWIGDDGRMTLEQLRICAEQGWDNMAHTTQHQDLTTVSDSEAEQIVYEAQKWLLDNGFREGARLFATTNNEITDSVEEIASQYHIGPLRYEGGNVKYNSLPYTGLPRNVRFLSFDRDSVAEMKTIIDDLEYGSDGFAPIVWHPSDTAADLEEIVSYVDQQANVDAVTHTDVFA